MCPRTPGLVLIVEDDGDIARLTRVALELEQLETMVADNGGLGLHLARLHEPDLVLLDIDIPVMDGLDVLKRLRADTSLRDVAVVMMTASSRPHTALRAIELGADDYVTKPFDVFVLVERVRAVLSMGPAARNARRQATLTQLKGVVERRRNNPV